MVGLGLFTDGDFLVWAAGIVALAVYVHSSYFKEVRQAVEDRNADLTLTTHDARLPETWLNYAVYAYVAAFVLTFLQLPMTPRGESPPLPTLYSTSALSLASLVSTKQSRW